MMILCRILEIALDGMEVGSQIFVEGREEGDRAYRAAFAAARRNGMKFSGKSTDDGMFIKRTK